MREKFHKFLKIFKVELEDLEDDIQDLVELTEKREIDKEITHYVCSENIALLKHEFSCMKRIVDTIDASDFSSAETLDDFVESLKQTIFNMIKDSGYPESLNIFIQRKLYKVQKYVIEEA